MPHREPPKPPPIEVDDVGRGRVPFLRPLEWIAVALRSFREKPLPSTYFTDAQPVFDLFGNARIEQVQHEQVLGTLGQIEVLTSQTPANKYRLYLQMAYMHDDIGSHVSFAERQVGPVPIGGFPFAPLDDSETQVPLFWRVVRNATVPPLGRIGAQVDAMGGGGRITIVALFVEMDVGEPHGDIS
ncbi:MAG: hypothetical protein V3S55_10490 [Nitrospiraceae bacterium]